MGSLFGGSGSQQRLQREALATERQRQAGITRSTEAINAVFDSPKRQKQYADYVTALRDYYGQDVGRQKTIADRNLKFSNAKAGLTGGSAAVDNGRLLGDEYNRGLLASENQAQASLADLMNQDQQERLSLTSLARSGLDATTAAQNAAQSMQNNIATARSGATAKGLGDLFGGTADVYKQQQQAAQFRAGQLAPLGTHYSNPFSGR